MGKEVVLVETGRASGCSRSTVNESRDRNLRGFSDTAGVERPQPRVLLVLRVHSTHLVYPKVVEEGPIRERENV